MEAQYPLVNFSFTLSVPAFSTEDDNLSGFMEISGFSSKVDGDPYKEGVNNTSELFFPKMIKWENLKAKRGVIRGSGLITWIKTSISTLSFTPEPIVVTLMDAGVPAVVWTFYNAYPISLETSNLNAGSNNSGEVLVDTIEFKHSGFIRVDS